MRWNSQTLAKSWGRGCPLRLEQLADRTVPSISTLTYEGGILTVEGDAGNDTVAVAIADDVITVTANGETEEFTIEEDDPLTAVNVALDGGNDTLTLDLGVIGGDEPVTVDIRTGAGNDTVEVNADAIARESEVTLDVWTGAGNDEVAIDLGAIRQDATLNHTVNLGAGNDEFDLTTDFIRRDATVNAEVGAGMGNDEVTIDLGDVRPGAVIDLTSRLGEGNDELTLLAVDIADTAEVSGDVFAGLGKDTVDASDLDGFDAVTLEVTDPDAKEDSDDGGHSDGSGIEWAIGRLNEIADRLGGRVGDQLNRVIERLQGKLDS